MIINSNKTNYCRKLETAMLLGKPYNALANTTLNEKFNILVNNKPTDYPRLKYYAIGVGGHDIIDGNVGYTYSEHDSTDATLFNHVPFVMVPVTEDLTSTEQANYRFKIKETYGGVEYYCYYLKLIPSVDYNDLLYVVNVTDNVPSLSVLDTHTDKFLNPVPKSRTANPTVIDKVSYVVNVAKTEFSLFNAELVNINKAIEIKYGNKYKLTEVGVCFGEDITTTTGKEAVGVQIAFHIKVDINTSILINNATNNIVRNIEIGGVELLV